MSDIPHDETDKELEKLERKITKTYKQALKEMKEKVKAQTEKYEKDRQWWLQQIKDGKKTQEEFETWLRVKAMERDRLNSIVSTLSKDLSNSRDLAYSAINHHIPEVYAINANGSAYQIEKDIQMDMSFTLYDRQTVERLMRDNPQLLPKGDPPKNAKKWSQAKLRNELTQGILQGESNQNIAKRLERVFNMDMVSSIRNARTMTTSAECAGRLDSYKRAEKMGVGLTKIWMATLDDRTRHEHRLLDGQRKEIDEPFEVDGYELMYPADPAGEAFLVYNCRCTTISQVKGFEYDINEYRTLGGRYESYEEWKHAKQKKESFFGDVSRVPLPSEPIEVVSNVPPVKEWIDLIKQNTESEMLAWEDRNFGKLTEFEREALEEYTGNSFRWMNGYMRDVAGGMSEEDAVDKWGMTEYQIDLIDGCMSALDKFETERDIVLRRGTDFGDLAGLFMDGDFEDNKRRLTNLYDREGLDVIKDMFEGYVGEYGGFTSTSSMWDRGFNKKVEVLFFVPKGTSASSIMRISQFGTQEGETLLNARTPVRCLSIEPSDYHKRSEVRVYLEVLSQEEQKQRLMEAIFGE